MENSVNVANLFKRMDELGVSMTTVSNETGISTGNISDWKKGRSCPTAAKLIQLADYLDCSTDYILGLTDTPKPISIPKETAERILGSTKDFISESSIVHPPFMSNRVYFIHEKDYDKVLKIYDRAKAFDETIIDKETFLSLLVRYDNKISRAADASGYSIKPKNYIVFKKVYNVYVDSLFNEIINKKFK